MKIYQAISGIMSEVGAIAKDQKNQQQGFMYRGVDQVMNALQPLLIKYKVFVTPTILEHTREERTTKSGANLIYSVLTVNYKFYTEDGSFVEATVIGEGMDSGDKSSNKALSVAYKYACFQMFCIPTEEIHDPDAVTPEESKPAKPKKITEAQAKRMFALAAGNNDLVKEILKSYSYEKSTDIYIHDYDEICKKIQEKLKGVA